MNNIMVYVLTPLSEARLNPDGRMVTTVEILNMKYLGGTNQVEVEKVTINGKEYLVFTRAI